MPHANCNAFFQDILRVLVRFAMLAASLIGIGSAQAAPYSLCVNLADSSGHANGTQVFACDPSSVSRTLESNTFADPFADPLGGYSGSARASSDAFDKVKLFASAELTDYLPKSYVQSNGGIEFAASATANYTDVVTIKGPAEPAVLQLSFGVTGTLTQAGISAQLCYGFAFGGPVTGGTCVIGLPPVITVESAPFMPIGTPQPLNFQFMAVVFNSDGTMENPYSGSATADLEHTITLQELLVSNLSDQPMPGITLSSAGEFDYPLSPLNQVPAIPEPRAAVLMLAALGLLGLRQRCRHPRGAAR